MQSGILPRGRYKNKPQLVLRTSVPRAGVCIVCLLCVSCVLSLCHFACNTWRPRWGSSETERVSNPGGILNP